MASLPNSSKVVLLPPPPPPLAWPAIAEENESIPPPSLVPFDDFSVEIQQHESPSQPRSQEEEEKKEEESLFVLSPARSVPVSIGTDAEKEANFATPAKERIVLTSNLTVQKAELEEEANYTTPKPPKRHLKRNSTDQEDVEADYTTPKTENHLIKPASTCPPAPRKPRADRGKLDPTKRNFFVVSGDLDSVFFRRSDEPAIRKKIRVDLLAECFST